MKTKHLISLLAGTDFVAVGPATWAAGVGGGGGGFGGGGFSGGGGGHAGGGGGGARAGGGHFGGGPGFSGRPAYSYGRGRSPSFARPNRGITNSATRQSITS